jgi:type II secretory pathway pseudopilin PulG
MRREGGFTLVELLIGMTLSVFVISAGAGFFALAQKAFFRLEAREEAGQGALAALDRMRIDLLHAGRGLAREMAAGLVEAVRADPAELTTVSLEKTLVLAAEAPPGATRLALLSTAGVASGQELVLIDAEAGEAATVADVEPGAIVLSGPLERGYAPGTVSVALLEKVAYRLDSPANILRRRVNGGPAQPLMEHASLAVWTLDAEARLARIRLELDVEGAHPHEATVFLKNPALARSR